MSEKIFYFVISGSRERTCALTEATFSVRHLTWSLSYAGLLGTNNNEDHDEMIKPNNKPAENLYDFVNSWEITKNKRCRVSKRTAKKGLCHNKRTLRCRQIFKESTSPFARFFKTINPKPFREACKYDYRVCDDNSPKDLKHCNASAAYVEALRMRGEYVNYLPECGKCQINNLFLWETERDRRYNLQ